ncbi:DJ-1/PfpI family protein [Hirsutella rhossiliensis]|uniref:DJ-1/PfpI family domain-containing protein n=1 Tax=Hirsutella rhossiliensis TaxID=111463 RepID=A0A9P8N5N1_9HYPO|nr:DJ-1/PfpI family domain-containing protein [Hirsutella rhossiliensis]KAH0967300.1 DJ-1/PfpI family domain-containing protein [Hirsutella rhossiliensis]
MSNKVRIGVFIPNGAQSLDTACADVLGVMSKEYLSAMPPPLRLSHVVELAPRVDMAYITTPSQGGDIRLTSGMVLRATHDYTDAEVAPGRLDVVIVPGPDPSSEFDEGALEWLRRQFATPGVDVLSICTGIFVCGAAGILDGRVASGPRGLQDVIRARFPKVRLAGDRYRWVRDGNLWSSGGVTNGNDLMAAYARASSKHWPPSIVEMCLMLTDVGDRGQVYGQRQGVFTAMFGWQLLKSWVASFFCSAGGKDKAA